MRTSFGNPVVLTCFLLIGGCGPTPRGFLNYTLAKRDGHAALTVGKLTLVFEGIQPKEGLSAAGLLIVPGPGASGGGESAFGDVKVEQSWVEGVNTVAVDDYQFQLIENGSKIAFSDQTFAVNDRRRTVLVTKDGTTRITEEGDAGPFGWFGGLLGGILGTLLGVGGGVLGTYCSIKNTKTPAERRFMVRLSIGVWIAVVLLVLVPVALSLAGRISPWWPWGLFALFFVLGVPLTFWANRRQAALRRLEGPDAHQ